MSASICGQPWSSLRGGLRAVKTSLGQARQSPAEGRIRQDRRVTKASSTERSPVAFFILLLALAIPIWVASRFVGVIGAMKIPVTDLMLGFTPMTAAAILVGRAQGVRGLCGFLASAFDIRKLGLTVWLLPVLLLPSLIHALTFAALHLAGHSGAPSPNLGWLPLLVVITFFLAIGEEAGWTGYLTDPLQSRFGALGASLIIAVPWWAGHIPSILEIGGSVSDIVWWIPGAVGLRILIVWLYNNTAGALVAAVAFHTMLNVSRLLFYPAVGAHFDPVYQAFGYGIALAVAALVVMVWGPGSLTLRKRVDA